LTHFGTVALKPHALLGLGIAVETRVCAVTMVMQATAMISIATT
jgi:hypothetical protein